MLYKKSLRFRKKYYKFSYLIKVFKKKLFFKLTKKNFFFFFISNSKNNFFFLLKNIFFKPCIYFSYGILLKLFFLFRKSFKKKKKFFATFAKFFKTIFKSKPRKTYLIFNKIRQSSFNFLRKYFFFKIRMQIRYFYFIFKYKIFKKKKISFIKKKIKKRIK